MYESGCINKSCSRSGAVEEHYYPSQHSPMQTCSECGIQETQYISQFGIVFTGSLGKYTDRSVPGWEEHHANDGAHFAYAKNTPDGKPRAVWIDSLDKQRDFCRQEGLVNPKDNPSQVSVNEEGRNLTGRGMPGQWA